jgi:hypothetical protein
MFCEAFNENQLSLPEYFPQLREASLIQQLKEIDSQCKELSEKLDNKPLSNYLRLLHQKVDLVTDLQILSKVIDLGVEPQQITLSEGGIGFSSTQVWTPGQQLVIGLLFSPSYQVLYLRAEVVESDVNDKAQVHAHFTAMEESARQQLVKHLLAEQTRQHQLRKQDQ